MLPSQALSALLSFSTTVRESSDSDVTRGNSSEKRDRLTSLQLSLGSRGRLTISVSARHFEYKHKPRLYALPALVPFSAICISFAAIQTQLSYVNTQTIYIIRQYRQLACENQVLHTIPKDQVIYLSHVKDLFQIKVHCVNKLLQTKILFPAFFQLSLPRQQRRRLVSCMKWDIDLRYPQACFDFAVFHSLHEHASHEEYS